MLTPACTGLSALLCFLWELKSAGLRKRRASQVRVESTVRLPSAAALQQGHSWATWAIVSRSEQAGSRLL